MILPSNDSNPSTFNVRLPMSRISQRTSDSLGIPNALFSLLILLGSPLVEAINATKNKRWIQWNWLKINVSLNVWIINTLPSAEISMYVFILLEMKNYKQTVTLWAVENKWFDYEYWYYSTILISSFTSVGF